ncbi:hypothetical protein [Nitratireductor sp. StC3]|uniref:hypothetical protein n=1 Tax=Nitratireductor sp. StC3 TaxID=2126741 RepID=UPI000D0DB80B|nr:hypothetical protein [Nitratireductor sp. StC3]PSM19859.1 hypothetical protein C7T96_01960 [Nitratireductor sp. StC3]
MMSDAKSNWELTTQARERYAVQLFDIIRVVEAIEERAREGYRDLRLSQIYPFDLSRTEPARQLEGWLEVGHYRYVWYPTVPIPDPLNSSQDDYPELVIFW